MLEYWEVKILTTWLIKLGLALKPMRFALLRLATHTTISPWLKKNNLQKNLDLSRTWLMTQLLGWQMGYCSSTWHCALIYPHIPKHVGGSSLCGTREVHVHPDMFSRSVSPRFPIVGCVKNQVYSTTLSIPLGNLKLLAVCREMLESVWQNIKCCFDVCRATEEGHTRIIVPFCTNTLPLVLSLKA